MSDNDDYEVGYGRTPLHTRFKKGQSGNPKGPTKGVRRFATALDNALAERLTITERGRRISVSKLEVILKQLVNKAASGHLQSQKFLIAVFLAEEKQRNQTTEEQRGQNVVDLPAIPLVTIQPGESEDDAVARYRAQYPTDTRTLIIITELEGDI